MTAYTPVDGRGKINPQEKLVVIVKQKKTARTVIIVRRLNIIRYLTLIFRGISGMYKTDPSVAIIACLSFIASAFALFFFFGFSESMASYSQEMFEAEQCRYSIRFSEAITHSETETLISNLPVRTKNIIYESSLLDLDIRSSDNYETFKDGTPNMVWVEKGDKEDLTAGEVFTNYNQLDYSTQVSYIGETIVIGEKKFTVAAVIRNYPVYNDIYFSLEDYRSLTDKTDVLGIVFNHPLTQIERGALDGLVAECAAEYSQSPPLTDEVVMYLW